MSTYARSDVEWSDYLGNAATAEEILGQYLRLREDSDETLPAWCERQARELRPDSEADPNWSHVAGSLAFQAAQSRIEASPALSGREAKLLADQSLDHLMWLAAAPESVILSRYHRTFTLEPIPIDEMRASDLQEEAGRYPGATAYRVTIYEPSGRPYPEAAEALHIGDWLGIAWGAAATWAEVPSVKGGIEMWLNDPAAWETRN